MAHKILSANRLREVLHYDPLIGVFAWRVRTARCIHVGDVAGSIANGYRQIHIDGIAYLAHRLAWLWSHGSWPDIDLDHINGIRDDNRIANLRLATASQNKQNQHRLRSDNTSGATGVYWDRPTQKWRSMVMVDRKVRWLGYFVSKEEAIAVRKRAEITHYPFRAGRRDG